MAPRVDELSSRTTRKIGIGTLLADQASRVPPASYAKVPRTSQAVLVAHLLITFSGAPRVLHLRVD
eukprot:424155-Heterocapsa_arctica.AAC.1